MPFPTQQILTLSGQPATINTLPGSGQATKADSLSVVLANDTTDLEPSGAAVTGVTLPSGGVGIKGWLSAIFGNQSTIAGASGASPPSLASGASGVLGWMRKIVDVLSGTLTIVSSKDLISTATPVSGTISDTAAHTSAAFAAQFGRDVWVELICTSAVGSIQLFRSIDGGTTKTPMTLGAGLPSTTPGTAMCLWNLTSAFTGTLANEALFTASDGSLYYVQVTLTSGTLFYRINQ
jgi:hypothetical protein